MSKSKQEKPSTSQSNPKPEIITKIDTSGIKGGQHVSEALPKPEKPSKGNK